MKKKYEGSFGLFKKNTSHSIKGPHPPLSKSQMLDIYNIREQFI